MNRASQKWNIVIWSDEFRYPLRGSGNSKGVVEVPGERYQMGNPVSAMQWKGEEVKAWLLLG